MHFKEDSYLEQHSALILVDSSDIPRPHAQVVLLYVVGPSRVVVLAVMLRELQSFEDPAKQDVVQLDDVSVVGLALPLEVERDLNLLASLSVDRSQGTDVYFLRQVQLDTVEHLANAGFIFGQ